VEDQEGTQDQISAADEILKFKQLLDVGILTQEESLIQKRSSYWGYKM